MSVLASPSRRIDGREGGAQHLLHRGAVKIVVNAPADEEVGEMGGPPGDGKLQWPGRQFDLLAEDPFVDLRPIEAILVVDPIAGDLLLLDPPVERLSRRSGEARPCL